MSDGIRGELSGQSRAFWWAAASAGLMIIGSFGPWARAFIVTVYGVDGDGWFVIGAAVVALGMLYLYARRRGVSRWPLVVAAVAGGVGILVVAVDGEDIFGNQGTGEDEFFGDVDLIKPGWGIVMAGLASISLIAASVYLLLREKPAPEAVPPPPEAPSQAEP
jgi:hypothetical protein